MTPSVYWQCKMSLEHAPGAKPLVCLKTKQNHLSLNNDVFWGACIFLWLLKMLWVFKNYKNRGIVKREISIYNKNLKEQPLVQPRKVTL